MRVSKPFILHLPTCFVSDLKAYLKEHPPNFNYSEVYFYYIIYYLSYKMLTVKENNAFIDINMQFFKSATVSNIDKYIIILKNGYFLETDKFYLKGKKSIGYKINEKYTNVDEITEIKILPKMNLYKKMQKRIINKKAHYSRSPFYLQEMRKEFFDLELDYKKAFQFITDNKENYKNALIHYAAIQNLQDKRLRYFFKSKSNNRLNTNITSLWKELRQFFKGDYVSIDLANSQPFFLSILINTIINYDNIHSTGIMYDMILDKSFKTFGIISLKKISKLNQKSKKSNLVNLSLLIETTKNGLFYEYLQEVIKDKTRDEIKKITFEIYYSQNSSYIKNKLLFKKAFPYILEVVEILKRKNYKSLSIFMQQIESYIFIDCIAKKLVEAQIIPLTIHDSIIIKKQHHKKVLEIMKQVFSEQIGIIPTFKTETL
ncbi:MAG: hypothetical protein GXO80_10215 [Chlorobi bacterium]|nr:hypothetical protein [Chlorobiota bacterium]